MAERFNLTAQLQLQAPANTKQVANQIRKQLQGIGAVNVQVKNTKSIVNANKAYQQANKSIQNTNKSASKLNTTLRESARRFSVITLATGTLLAIANEFKNATKRAIEFEVELLKISQVTGKTASQLTGLSEEVTRLSTSLGVSNKSLLNTSRILAQAGFSAEAARKSLDVLAQTTLAATFDNIQDTTEGAIALLNQFGAAAKRNGKEAEFLEKSLDAINAVSKKFAVESSDLISVVRRVGGVFSSAGGSVEELIALFTSVRSTTREGAETIATGLRTIFTRIQRQDTVDQLKQLGIELRDAEGNFVGAFEAVKRLSEGLAGLDPRSGQFAAIAEELGGFRQIGKVIPLIQQFSVAQNALGVALDANGSIAADAIIAQQSLANQFAKTRESFDALIRKFANSETFRSIATFAIKLADAFIKVADSLEPLLPLLTTLFALKAGQGLASGLSLLRGFGGAPSGVRASRFATGGKVHQFARGGSVPGTGNRDTVPAMLTPGEFVIKKSSVKKLGVDTLAAMNENRFATGGIIDLPPNISRNVADLDPYSLTKASGAEFLQKSSGQRKKNKFGPDDQYKFNLKRQSLNPLDTSVPKRLRDTYSAAKTDSLRGKAFEKIVENQLGVTLSQADNARLDAVKGNDVFEIKSRKDRVLTEREAADKMVGAALKIGSSNDLADLKMQKVLTQKPLRTTKDTVDFGNIIAVEDSTKAGSSIKKKFTQADDLKLKKLKKSLARLKKDGGTLGAKKQAELDQLEAKKAGVGKFNKGGGVSGQDTVPALLTPGEFVFNKKAAQNIGYGNLNRMNKQGVQGFNSGGTVGFRRYANGTAGAGATGLPGGSSAGLGSLQILKAIEAETKKYEDRLKAAGNTQKNVEKATKAFNNQLKKGVTVAKAREKVDKALTKTIQKQAAERQKQKGGGTGGAGGGVGARLQGAGSSLQQIAFFSSIVGATAVQMAGLGEAAEKAATQTIAEIGTFAAIGGVFADLGGSVLQNKNINKLLAKTKLAEAGASKTSAAADIQEATASKGASIAMGALSAGAIAAIAVFAVFSFKQKKAAAEAEILAKSASKAAEELLKVGDAASASTFRADTVASVDKTIESEAFGSAKITAGISAFAGALGGAIVAGAAFGSALGPPGIALGIFAGLVAGTAGGLTAYNLAIAEAKKKQEEQREALDKSINTFIEVATASALFSKKLQDINDLPLPEEEKLNRRTSLLREETKGSVELKGATEASSTLERLAIESGKTVGQLKSLSEEDIQKLKKLSASQRQQLSTSIKTLSESQKSLSNKLKLASQSLATAASQELTGTSDIDAILADPTSNVAKSFNALKKITLDQAKVKEAELQAQIASKEELLLNASGLQEQRKLQKELATLEGERGKATTEANKKLRETEDALATTNQKAKENLARINEEILARRELIAIVNAQKEAINQFNDAISGIDNQIQSLDFNAAIAQGETPDIKISGPDLSSDLGFNRISRNLQKFDGVIASLPPKFRDSAEKASKSLQLQAAIVNDVTRGAEGQEVISREGLELEDFGLNRNTLLKAFGGSTKKVKEFEANLEKVTKEVGQAGRALSQDDIDAILAPLRAANEKNAEIIAKSSELFNKSLERSSKILEIENQARERQIDRVRAFNEASLQGVETLASARGESVGQARLAEEKRGAQRVLAAGRQGRGGVRLEAGNVRQLQLAKQQALATRKNVQSQIAFIKATGQGVNRLAGLQKILSQQQNIIKDVNGEFQRLSKSTTKVSILQEKLEQAGRAREQQFAILEEFVVGGQSERQALVSSFQGLQAAIATGTTQNQTDESRKATFGLLDKLSDVILPGVGLTGEETKQELIFRDAVRLGFPPGIAKELATSTTVEQKILTQLEKQTDILRKLAPAAGNATGGLIYRANGGTIFKPRGTDTVPAMLTPGEFVIRKSAVDKIGAGNLSALNSGQASVVKANGGPIYRQQGGDVFRLPRVAFPNAEQFKRILEPIDPGQFIRNVRRTERFKGFFKDQRNTRQFINLVKTGQYTPSQFIEQGYRASGLDEFLNGVSERLNKSFEELTPGNPGTAVKKKDFNQENAADIGKLYRTIFDNPEAPKSFSVVKFFQKAGGKNAKGILDAFNATQPFESGVNSLGTLLKTFIGRRGKNIEKIAAINLFRANGGPIYRAKGGPSGQDRVPAMLTPGEFVMSPEAVNRHGIGFMNQLNRGKVPGFRQGGVVGGPQYKFLGGVLDKAKQAASMVLDASQLEGVFNTFSSQFGESLTNVVNSFSTFSQNITSLTNALSQGMTVNHNFTGDMTLAFKIENGDALKNAVGEAITPKIQELVSGEINRRIDELKNGTAG